MKPSIHRSHRPTHRAGGAGIGMLVVLIAVVIGMWLLFGQKGPGGSTYIENIQKTQEDSKSLAITLQARQVAMLVAQQEAATGTYPESMDEIDGFDPSTFVDEWGQPYRMELIREGRRVRSIEIRSAGPDGLFGTDDDVVHLENLPY
jgi:hypothetical protein